jgi:integrase
MAGIVRQPRTRYWIACFYDSRGKQHRRSTRETDKKRAIAVAQQFERVAKQQGSPARVKQIFSEFFRDHFGESLELSTSVRDYTARWLAARKAETSIATYDRYSGVVRKFLAFLAAAADRSLDMITREKITEFRDAQLAVSAPATVNTDMKTIRAIFRTARRDGLLLEDPSENVKPVKSRATFERRPFTIDELRIVLGVANEEWRSLIKCGLYTGQRLGDLATLTWSQVDLSRDEIRMQVRKTGKTLLVPIAAPLREHLLSLAASDDPKAALHPRAFASVISSHGRVALLSAQFGALLVACGLRVAQPPPHPAKRELSFHSLRHTAVSLLKDAGVPDAVVMELVGHESKAMSQHYTHVGREALAKAAAAMPGI